MNKVKVLFDNRNEIPQKAAEAKRVLKVYHSSDEDYYELNDDGIIYCDFRESKSGFIFQLLKYNIECLEYYGTPYVANTNTLVYEKGSLTFNSEHAFFNFLSFYYDSIEDVPLNLLFKHLKIDWFHKNLFPLLSTEQLLQIIEGEITNPIRFLQSFVAEYEAACSLKKLYKAIQTFEMKSTEFMTLVETAQNIDHALDLWIKMEGFNYSHEVSDLISLSALYNKKINFRWSEQRMMDEHNKLVGEFNHFYTPIKISGPVPNLEYLPELPEYFTILDTGEAICKESKKMSHCLAAVYGEQVMANTYLAFHVKYKNEEATLGVRWTENGIEYDQLVGQHNEAVSEKLKCFCEIWIQQNTVRFKKRDYQLEEFLGEEFNQYEEPPF